MKGSDRAVTFLGKDILLEGKLRFEGAMRIDGHFRGEIHAKGNLTVGEQALIEGDIYVSYASVLGEIRGNIMAEQRVDLHAPGKVFGNIQSPSVVIDEGVIFEGSARMYQAKGAAGGNTALIGSDEYQGGPPPNLTAIYGVARDESTGKPIKGVKIVCKGDGKAKTETNASGYYELINLKEGTWKLKAEAQGYRKEKSEVVITGMGTYEQNYDLKPK
ncbi:MAG: polymer-forming cytoskeletal protein [Deltaproteobacteria bacterium]|nr:polymer-forming cytoskeletal protein [Deltaproteobacteria bacterium]